MSLHIRKSVFIKIFSLEGVKVDLCHALIPRYEGVWAQWR
jgi:hypothetical protein